MNPDESIKVYQAALQEQERQLRISDGIIAKNAEYIAELEKGIDDFRILSMQLRHELEARDAFISTVAVAQAKDWCKEYITKTYGDNS